MFFKEDDMVYWCDKYIVGFHIRYDRANTPSLQRYPVSYGPFATEKEAEDFAAIHCEGMIPMPRKGIANGIIQSKQKDGSQ